MAAHDTVCSWEYQHISTATNGNHSVTHLGPAASWKRVQRGRDLRRFHWWPFGSLLDLQRWCVLYHSSKAPYGNTRGQSPSFRHTQMREDQCLYRLSLFLTMGVDWWQNIMPRIYLVKKLPTTGSRPCFYFSWNTRLILKNSNYRARPRAWYTSIQMLHMEPDPYPTLTSTRLWLGEKNRGW